MIWDYWLNGPHDDCDDKCSSPLHNMFEAYMDPPSGNEPLSKMDKILVHTFELRMDLDFSLDDVLKYSLEPSDQSHLLVKVSFQYMALDFRKFTELYNSLLGLLGERKKLLLHLMPLSAQVNALIKKMPEDLRNLVVHPGGGIFGTVSALGNEEDDSKRVPDHSLLVCANLINTFVDGLIDVMPHAFYSALSKTQSNLAPVKLYDFRSFAEQTTSYWPQHPTHCIDFTSMDATSTRLASDLIRLRWTLQTSLSIYELTKTLQTIPRHMPKIWGGIKHQQILYYVRRIIVELDILVDLYEEARRAGITPPTDDDAIKELFAQKGNIGCLRDMVAHWKADDSYEEFSAALESRIGNEKLLFLAAIVYEWVRINANNYQETSDVHKLRPSKFVMDRLIDFTHVDHQVKSYRERAHQMLKERNSGVQ